MFWVIVSGAVILSVLTVLGDYYIKEASLRAAFSGWGLLLVGMMLYALTGLGWFFLMRHEKLYVLGLLYVLTTTIFLTALSVLYYHESLGAKQLVALLLGLVAVILLYQ